jgi:REP element-mobilizing transposase RayT
MAKLRRQYVEGQTYHTVAVTHERAPLFSNEQAAQIVVDAINHTSATQKAYVLAYAVMPDHLHLLLVPRGEHTVSTIMHSIKSYSAREIQRRNGHKGSVWQASFLDRIILGDAHLSATLQYIVQNPVTAGLVSAPEGYRFSSAHPVAKTDNEAFWSG